MKHIKILIVAVFIVVLLAGIANLPATIRVGVDGHYRTITMPLYVKWTQFLARHYEYQRLARETVAGCKTDEEKALAILKWTHENLRDVPAGMPVCDDHILNIIIRGYGAPEQFQDVFTTLCVYAGIPAYMMRVYNNGHTAKYTLSVVLISGTWRFFDAHKDMYFKNGSALYNAISPTQRPTALRAEKQMPLPRILFEIKKALKIEKDENNG